MSLSHVVETAARVAGAQHYPEGALYVVATPIGNRADMSLRALHVLATADAVACEDTRHTRTLLAGFGLDRPLLALHQHNEAEAAQAVLARLARGERVACVTDAGTPGVSDPGARVVAAVHAAGHPVVPVPGASSVVAAVSATGGVDERGFVFAGFLPSKAAEREAAVQALAAEPRAVVLLEAPHRIEALARALAGLGTRPVGVARELTKQHEQVVVLPCAGLAAWLAADPVRQRGEFALVLHALAPRAAAEGTGADALDAQARRTLEVLLPLLPLKTAVAAAAACTGAPRNALYAAALALRQAGVDSAGSDEDGSADPA